jgi:hypothetical protein
MITDANLKEVHNASFQITTSGFFAANLPIYDVRIVRMGKENSCEFDTRGWFGFPAAWELKIFKLRPHAIERRLRSL